MDINSLIDTTRSVPFRKTFYLAAIVLAAVLLVLKHQLLPFINRNESGADKILRRILDTLIVLVFITIALASVFFWLTGNE